MAIDPQQQKTGHKRIMHVWKMVFVIFIMLKCKTLMEFYTNEVWSCRFSGFQLRS